MKIGLVCTAPFSYPGGIQEHVLALHKYFKKMGHPTKIITPRNTLGEKDHDDIIYLGGSIPLLSNDTHGSVSFCLSPSSIHQLMEKEGFNVIHYHSPYGLFLTWQIMRAANCLNIGTFHTSLEGTIFEKHLKQVTYYVQEQLISKLDGVIVVSKIAGQYLPFRPNIPVTEIPNGVDLERFHPHHPKIKRFVDDKLNLLFLGRFEGRKGLHYLLNAYKILKEKYPFLRLIIVGGGALALWYKNWVRVENLCDVEFVGVISPEDVPRYYCTADIYCSPATHGESFGIVLIEAMASGCPVVAYANAGYKRVLRGKGARFLARSRSVSGLVDRISQLVEDERLRKEMRKWSLQEVKKYGWDKVAARVIDFYKQVQKTKQPE